MLIWLMSHLSALPRRARQHDNWVASAVTPALCLSAFFLPPQAWPPRPSTWPDRHVSRGHEARPEKDRRIYFGKAFAVPLALKPENSFAGTSH